MDTMNERPGPKDDHDAIRDAARDQKPRPSEEPHLDEYDKQLADSFPASDPPVQP